MTNSTHNEQNQHNTQNSEAQLQMQQKLNQIAKNVRTIFWNYLEEVPKQEFDEQIGMLRLNQIEFIINNAVVPAAFKIIGAGNAEKDATINLLFQELYIAKGEEGESFEDFKKEFYTVNRHKIVNPNPEGINNG